MFRIHNPEWLDQIFHDPGPRERKSRVRFQAGTLQDLKRLTEKEWQESKKEPSGGSQRAEANKHVTQVYHTGPAATGAYQNQNGRENPWI